MSFQHFDQEELVRIADAIHQVIGYAGQVRSLLIAGLPRPFTGLLPGAPPPEKIALLLDLNFMNTVERLTDGAVPLKIFLQNVISLAGTLPGTEAVRDGLEQLNAKTTGSLRVAIEDLPETKERIVFQDDMVPYGFMDLGLAAGRAVAKLLVPRFDNGAARMNATSPMIYLGTGWVFGPGLLITNHHVVNARNDGEAAASEADLEKQVAGTKAIFDYDADDVVGTSCSVGALVAWDRKLDYAVVRVPDGGRTPLRLTDQPIATLANRQDIAVNIIQHPDGRAKKYAIRNNILTAVTPTELRYFTDTVGGSSGSPVFDDSWRVVALHRGSALVRNVKFQGRDVAYVNVGTQLTAIMADLRTRYAGKLPEIGI